MNKEQIRKLIKSMGISMDCPRCGAEYDLNDIDIKSHDGNTYNLKLLCHICHTPVTAAISIAGNWNSLAKKMINPSTVNKKPLDIAKSQTANKTKKEKITSDDVIDMHQFLKKFDGDFEKEFN